jgi:hypothetical protein
MSSYDDEWVGVPDDEYFPELVDKENRYEFVEKIKVSKS